MPCDDFTNKIIYPSEARLRMLSYTIKVSFHVEQYQDIQDLVTEQVIETKKVAEDDIVIATIPDMVKCKYCNLVAHKSIEEDKKGTDLLKMSNYFDIFVSKIDTRIDSKGTWEVVIDPTALL